MTVVGPLFGGLEMLMREAGLFAATGFLLLGFSDLVVDLLWLALCASGRLAPPAPDIAALPPAREAGTVAVLIPAWDEAAVIGAMLRNTLAAWEGEDILIVVGCYPNDPATLSAVQAVKDPRLRVALAGAEGPTTKADCLNAAWRALLETERERGGRCKAVLLHDAEDIVHPAEPRLFASLLERWDFVQLPVRPLIDPDSRWIGGHYADEFAEAHGKDLRVRERLGAALPAAGVGCAFERTALERAARRAGGRPFDPASLTEDYELGLRLAELGCTACLACIPERRGGAVVATREYFPGTLAGAVRQKARWMTGIALLGWDRLGWRGGLAERWMRLRDRQALLAALLLFAGYLSFALWLVLKLREGLTGAAPAPLPPLLSLFVTLNAALLAWRLAVRCAFTARTYGLAEGLRAVPRAAVSNLITILAAVRAVGLYRAHRRTGRPRWDKTAHRFPSQVS